MKQRKKDVKVARAIEEVSRRITVVKKKMDCIKNDLGENLGLYDFRLNLYTQKINVNSLSICF